MRRLLGVALSTAIISGACSAGSSTPSSPPTTSNPAPASASPLPGVAASFAPGLRPSGIVAAEDVIWAEDHAASNKVYAVDPATGQVEATIGVTRPCDVAIGFARIWVADLAGARLTWIDPTTRAVGGAVSGLRGACGVQAVDGALWLAVDDGLARVDPETATATIEKLDGAAFPGAGTPLWAALFDTGELVRIDTATGAVTQRIEHPEGRIEGPPVASGFDSLWVGGSDGVYRLDAVDGTVDAEIDASRATRLLVTGDAVWVTSYLEGTVERIDPTRNEVVFRARFPGTPNGITEGFGAIWVSDTQNGLLYRIDPSASGTSP